MFHCIDTNKEIRQVFMSVKSALQSVGKLTFENHQTYLLEGKYRYILQSIKIQIELKPLESGTSIHILATCDDIWENGPRKVLEKLVPAIEKNLSQIPSPTSLPTNEYKSLNSEIYKLKESISNSSITNKGLNDDFHPTSFSFNSGVMISVNLEKITVNSLEGGLATIDSKNYDNISYEEFYEGRVSRSGLWFRFVGISAALVISAETFFGGWSMKSWGLAVILFIINVIVLIIHMLDSFLELNIFSEIIRKHFSDNGINVVIGNSSGTNITFIIHQDEKSKLEELVNCLNNLKKVLQKNIAKSAERIYSSPTTIISNLDELKKLGELYKAGIISDEEFASKKTELLK